MRRLVASLLALVLLTSCSANPFANFKQNITRFAEEKLQDSLAGQLVSALGGGISTVVSELARPGGYLDNPLVRILLPPPIAVALDLIRDFSAKPDANPLVVLMNRAAETAVPGAGPILQTALEQMTPEEARGLIDAGNTAGTDYLKAKTQEKLKEALAPAVIDSLTQNNGLAKYGELLTALRAQQAVSQPPGEPTMDQPITDLGDYVTQQTVDGIFKALGAEELRIREDLDLASVDMQSLIQQEADPEPTQPPQPAAAQ